MSRVFALASASGLSPGRGVRVAAFTGTDDALMGLQDSLESGSPLSLATSGHLTGEVPYNYAPAAAVPEPGSLALLGTALPGFGMVG